MAQRVFILLLSIIGIISCNNNSQPKKFKSIDDERRYGIETDTTTMFAVYGGLCLGEDTISAKSKMHGTELSTTHLSRVRKVMLDINVSGSDVAFRKYVGAPSVASMSEVLRLYPDKYKDFKERIVLNPKYGSLKIDWYKNLYSTSVVIDCLDPKNNLLKEDVSGWYTYLENRGVVTSVVCIFDVRDYQFRSYGGISAFCDGFVKLLSEKYGSPQSLTDGYCWIVGKYEVQLTLHKVNNDYYEILLNYKDNEAEYYAKQAELEAKQKSKDSLQLIHQQEQDLLNKKQQTQSF